MAGRISRDAGDLQREFNRVMNGTSSLREEQQDMITDEYFTFLDVTLQLARRANRDRQARRRRRQNDPDLSTFEDISLDEDDNPDGQSADPGPPGPSGPGGPQSTPPWTLKDCLEALGGFFYWSVNFFSTRAAEMWNDFYILAERFICALNRYIFGGPPHEQ